MTYSFPCQDLSRAGQMKGMSKDSSTRSGMLWQVERILEECNGNLPDILLMENVPDVIGTKNKDDFAKWYQKLEQLGYANFYEILNAKNYGIPQNRERCFMVSILGDYYYNFPSKIKLEKRLKDLLEKDVDEKFFLSDEKITRISNWKAQQDPLKDIDKEKPICPTLTARDAGEEHSGMVLINEKVYGNQSLNETLKENVVEDCDFIDTYNKCVKKDVAGTITTRVSGANRTFVAQASIPLKRGYSVDIKEETQDTDKVDVIGNYSKSNFNQTKIVGKNGVAPCVTENHGEVTAIPIKNNTKQGYLMAHEGDGVNLNGRMEYQRGNVQKGMSQTLKTSIDVGVVVQNHLKRKLCNELIEQGKVKENDVIRHSYSTSRMNKLYTQNRSDDKCSPTLDTRCVCLGVVVKEEK